MRSGTPNYFLKLPGILAEGTATYQEEGPSQSRTCILGDVVTPPGGVGSNTQRSGVMGRTT